MIKLYNYILIFVMFLLTSINSLAQSTTCGGIANIPKNGTININGVAITSVSTGAVDLYAPAFYGVCAFVPANSLKVGQHATATDATSAPWKITLSFDKPVNDLIFLLAGGGPSEESFVFNGNNGSISTSTDQTCFSSTVGNKISIWSDTTAEKGGGKFKIHSISPFTQLVIEGNGGSKGSVIGLCSESVKEVPLKCFISDANSKTGWKAKVYDAPNGINGWVQISASTGFPTSSYIQVATFDYTENVNSSNAFDVLFKTGEYGLTSNNPQIKNYNGTPISFNSNEDYAVLFSKTIVNGEEGVYRFDLGYGDDHIFIYKNGVKLNQQENAYSATPIDEFATIDLIIGDTISILIVEEYTFNTEVQMVVTKLIVPPIQNLTNGCPSETVNLNDAHTGTAPTGSTVVWFTNNAHTGTALSGAEITQANAGTYYAFYYNSVGSCYSAASNPVVVTISNCLPLCDGPDSDGDGIPDMCDLDDDNDGILDTDECPFVPSTKIIVSTDTKKLMEYDTAYNTFKLLCSNIAIAASDFVGDIAMDANGKIYGITNSQKLIVIDPNTCQVTELVTTGLQANNSLSMMPDGNLLAGGGTSTGSSFIIKKIDVVGGTYAVTNWHNFSSGSANGDFIFIGNKAYILWFDTAINATYPVLLEVKVDSNFNYVSHTVLGTLPRFTFGLAKANGDQLYSVRGDNGGTIERINYNSSPFSWTTIGTYSDNFYGATSIDESLLECDTDGDGIPDRLDLDSDNDGCPDAIEGSGTFVDADLTTASGTLSTQSPNRNFGVDVDAYGVPTVVGAAGQGVGVSQNPEVNGCPIESQCITGDCNENAFLFTSDPNTLEYDNLISGFHSSIAKQNDGNYLIWGQGAKPNTFGEHLYAPTLITPDNGFNYTGEILKATLGTRGATNDGSDQYAILTTDGLYIWGGGDPMAARKDGMVHRSVKDSQTFDKMTNANITNAEPATGLPIGVSPTDVKMMFGSYATLAIVTCTGDAYILSHAGNKNGDGSTDTAANQNQWHRGMIDATTPLNRVVAMRGVPGAMFALTYDGDLYTWGTDTYLGNGTAKTNRLYATKMTLPAGVVPKMIGMTKASNGTAGVTLNSYYVLSTTGDLYSLGDNSKKQLGTFDTVEKNSWVNVKSTDASTNMTNISWISPNEHDAAGHAAVTALTTDGKLWGWGMNHGNMLGEGNAAAVDPRYMFGALDHDEKVLAIETGGHINTIFKDCDFKLGYIGHSSNGSYAKETTNTGTTSNVFKFDGAKLTNLCAIYTPPFPEVSNMRVCYGETVDLTDALSNSAPAGYTLEWWTTINRTAGTEVTDPTTVTPGTYYAFFARDVDDCPLLDGEEVVVELNPTTVLQQDVQDITISVNNNYSYTVGTVSHPDPLPSGYDVQYTWEYATADNPTVWNVLDNTTFSGEITLTGSTLSISHATKDIDGIKVRVTAQTVYESPLNPEVIGPVDCITQSNEFLITIKAGAVLTNPMLLNRAR